MSFPLIKTFSRLSFVAVLLRYCRFFVSKRDPVCFCIPCTYQSQIEHCHFLLSEFPGSRRLLRSVPTTSSSVTNRPVLSIFSPTLFSNPNPPPSRTRGISIYLSICSLSVL